MDMTWIDEHRNKFAQALNGKIFTGVSCNTEHISRTSRTEAAMVLTLVVSGRGRIRTGGRTWDIEPDTVLFRHPKLDYELELFGQTFHRRCYLVMPPEVFTLMNEVHPDLTNIPPVFHVDDVRRLFDDFLLVYESIHSSTGENFFSLLPVVERYMLHVLSSYLVEGKAAKLRRVKARLEMDYTSSLEEIADDSSMSYNTLRKNFVQAYGISPQQYRLKCKVEKARQLLSMGYLCSEVSDMLGYPDLYTFSHQFKSVTGISPRDFRKGHII